MARSERAESANYTTSAPGWKGNSSAIKPEMLGRKANPPAALDMSVAGPWGAGRPKKGAGGGGGGKGKQTLPEGKDAPVPTPRPQQMPSAAEAPVPTPRPAAGAVNPLQAAVDAAGPPPAVNPLQAAVDAAGPPSGPPAFNPLQQTVDAAGPPPRANPLQAAVDAAGPPPSPYDLLTGRDMLNNPPGNPFMDPRDILAMLQQQQLAGRMGGDIPPTVTAPKNGPVITPGQASGSSPIYGGGGKPVVDLSKLFGG